MSKSSQELFLVSVISIVKKCVDSIGKNVAENLLYSTVLLS